MIATWMLYCLVCALGLCVAAMLAERALLVGSGSVRFVWLAAVLLSLIVPVAALRTAPRSAPVYATARAADGIARPGVLDGIPDAFAGTSRPSAISTAGQRAAAPSGLRMATLETFLSRFDRPLLVVWIVLSVAVALNFLGGVVALARMRRRWEPRTVHGIPLFVSERIGPAVVGVIAPAIVLPEWTLGLTAQQLALMLRHEQEHRRMGDGRLVAMAQIALIVMPWNIALWWQVRRLRVAVELDCDVRVLRDADARSYGDLLLEVARPRQARLVGATAFAERATQLERRIRMLVRHRVPASRRARVAAVCIGCAAMTVAWVAPHPAVRLGGTLREARALPHGDSITSPSPTVAAVITSPPPVAFAAPRTVPRIDLPRPIVLSALPEPIQPPRHACVLASGQQASATVDAIFDALFDGIALGLPQAVQACELLTGLQQRQDIEDQGMMALLEANRERTLSIQAARDSVLRTLLTNDADRATFDANLNSIPAGGGRGRSGGPPPDFGGRGRVGGPPPDSVQIRGTGRSGGGGRGALVGDSVVWLGRGGRGGGAGSDSVRARLMAIQGARLVLIMTDLTFQRLFAGISLTPDQESAARALIAKTQQETQLPMVPPTMFLRMNPRIGRVSMHAESAATLMALVGSDADREKLQSRIMSIPQ